jgi:methanethiol S-methyltransferase
MRRWLALLYALLVYLLFLGVFLYVIGFVEGMGVPKHVDSGAARGLAPSLAIDLGWIALFGLQHSIMARASFKRWWTRLVPGSIERATYVLATSLLFVLLIFVWAPLPQPLVEIGPPALRAAIRGLSFAGWGLVLLSTLLYDHLELFGLRQAWDGFRGRAAAPLRFRTPSLYRYVRHPMYLGLLVALWATPSLTLGHLVFAGGMSAYLLVGVWFEERDLVRNLGDDYRGYQARVGRLLPRLFNRTLHRVKS